MKYDQARKQAQPTTVLAETVFNRRAERLLLGRLLADDKKWIEVADKLKPEDFGVPRHDIVYMAMAQLSARARSLTHANLLSQIGENAEVDSISLGGFLDSIYAEAVNPEAKESLDGLIEIIQHCSIRRQLMRACDQIKRSAAQTQLDTPIAELQQSAAKLIENCATADEEAEERMIVAVQRVVSVADANLKAGKKGGIRSGFEPFDELVGPMMPGNLIVIAGETGSGKTALATQVGAMMACGIGSDGYGSDAGELTEQAKYIGVRMTSLEMESDEVATRIIARWSDIDSKRIFGGDLTKTDLDHMEKMGQRLVDKPFWIDPQPRQTVSTIQARLARAKIKYGIKVGIVDHLQYVRDENSRADLHERIAQRVDDLKAAAKRLQMVIILLSHVSRAVEIGDIHSPADIKRPALHHLYGSSAIEKAADAVVFVHRPYWFLNRGTAGKKYVGEWEAAKDLWYGKAELVLPKRRAGPGFGVEVVNFNEGLTWFSPRPEGL